MPINLPALAVTDAGAAAVATSVVRAGEGDAAKVTGPKSWGILSDCLGVWPDENGAGDVALEFAESNEDVAAW
jgi:hypothetical protein